MDDTIISEKTASNDRAFIKVAIELRQLENGIEVAKAMKAIQKRMTATESSHRNAEYNSYHSDSSISYSSTVQNAIFTNNCAEAMAGYIPFIEGLRGGFKDLDPFITKAQERIKVLESYIDLYCDGKDIVMARLARTDEEEESE